MTNCQAWDGTNGTTDITSTYDTTATTGGNPTLLGIRFKAIGTNPTFVGWQFRGIPTSSSYSFYIHNWGGSWIQKYANGVTLSNLTNVYLAEADYVSLTVDNEYIASVYIAPWYTVYVNEPLNYPSATSNMSVTSGSGWYYAGLGGWPNVTWVNANPNAPNNWMISPIVCQG